MQTRVHGVYAEEGVAVCFFMLNDESLWWFTKVLKERGEPKANGLFRGQNGRVYSTKENTEIFAEHLERVDFQLLLFPEEVRNDRELQHSTGVVLCSRL